MPPNPTLENRSYTDIIREDTSQDLRLEAMAGLARRFRRRVEDEVRQGSRFTSVLEFRQAEDAIQAKANSLGVGFTGSPTADMEWNGAGYQRLYGNCVIYFSPETGAHEMHGDILAKYQSVNGPAAFGLPVTDETGTPDGIGRYNHLARTASIYWTPNTGAMAVTGPVRDRWAAAGWERGSLGYPVKDTFSPAGGESVGDFQNGAIWAGPAGTPDPVFASLAPDRLLSAIWLRFDTMVHESPDNIGLHPHRSIDSVSDYGWGFWQSRNRLVAVQINGFHDNGLAPDTNFTAYLTLLFEATARADGGDDVTVALSSGRVTASGLGSQAVSDGVANAISDAFKSPMVLGTIPKEAPLLSLKVAANGGLFAYLPPTVEGGFARGAIQLAMDSIGQ